MMPNVLSIDLEDWFHVLDAEASPDIRRWSQMESRIEKNTMQLLDLLRREKTLCTFFVLGWVAETYPELIREIVRAGHEIGSHGYGHILVYRNTREAFRADLLEANEAITKVCGVTPRGYRAPGFSVTSQTPWVMDVLREEGFVYDSSIFPAPRGHGGFPGASPYPYVLANGLVEFPISTIDLGFTRLAFLGGGYLRLLPLRLIHRCSVNHQKKGIPLIFYLHPRDIDAGQPRLDLGPWRGFKSYVGLKGCLHKVSELCRTYSWIPFREYPMAQLRDAYNHRDAATVGR